MRASLLFLTLLVLTSGCSARKPGAAAPYSFDFWTWMSDSMALRTEVDGLRSRLGQPSEDAGLRSQLEEAARRQTQINAKLLASTPPPEWRAYHGKIVEALDRYNRLVGDIAESREPARDLLGRIEDEQSRLRQRVTICYTHSTACR